MKNKMAKGEGRTAKDERSELRSERVARTLPAPFIRVAGSSLLAPCMNAKKDSLSYWFTLAALVRQFGKGGLKPI